MKKVIIFLSLIIVGLSSCMNSKVELPNPAEAEETLTANFLDLKKDHCLVILSLVDKANNLHQKLGGHCSALNKELINRYASLVVDCQTEDHILVVYESILTVSDSMTNHFIESME